MVANTNQEHVARRPAYQRGDHGCISLLAEGLKCGAQIAFGVEEERGRGDHFLALRQAISHLDITFAAAADFHGPRLEAALALRYQHDLPRPAIDQGAIRYGRDISSRSPV